MEFLLFQPLLPQAKSIAVPVQYLDLVPGLIDEYIQRTSKRVQTQLLFDHHAQAINRFPEVDRLPAQIDQLDITARVDNAFPAKRPQVLPTIPVPEAPTFPDAGQTATLGCTGMGAAPQPVAPGTCSSVHPRSPRLSISIIQGGNREAVDGAPGQPREFANALSGGVNLQQLDHKCFHQERDSAVAFSPWHGQFFDCTIAVFELGYTHLDERLKLAGIQMSPLALSPTVDVSSLRAVRRIRPHLTCLENNFNNDALIRQGEVNRLHRPRRFQSKRMFVKGIVFHDGIGVFEKRNPLTLREISQYI